MTRAIEAANRIVRNRPYCYGGGHRRWQDRCYDCSGSVSYALGKPGARVIDEPMASSRLETIGKRGRGRWISVYANSGHAYAVIAGLRLDTSMTRGGGPIAFAPRRRAALGAFGQFVAALAARYGRGGTFWLEHPELPRRPIKYWQIWNEQNSRDFFKPKTRPRAYAKLLRTAARAIDRVDRSADVLTGGMAELAGSRRAVTGSRYLARLYRIRGIEHAFDAVAVHPYGANVGGATAQVRRFRRIMVAAGDRRAALWITETGWSSAGGAHPLMAGRRGQAKRLKAALGYYRRERRRLHIGGVIWFSWRDSGVASCEWCARSGLLTRGGRGKPAFRALRSVARAGGGS